MTKALARQDTAAFRTLDHAAVAGAIDAIEHEIGGRQTLVETLTHAPQTDDLAYVINLIADPSMDARKLSSICRAGNIHPGELIEAYKRGAYAKMQIAVVQQIATRAPAVVEDVMVRAAPHLVDCPACKGVLTVLNESWDPKKPDASDRYFPCVCAKTESPGRLLLLPAVDRQRLALDLAQLLPKAGPAVVVNAQQQHAHFDASPKGFAALLADTDAVLHRGRRQAPEVVDAEPLTDPAIDGGFDPD